MMGTLQYKILCPAHQESTPSCAVYDDGSGFCFSCGAYFSKLTDVKPVFKEPPENLEEKITYIRSLDTQLVRGLQLPVDKDGYYIVWPDGTYYKMRRWNTEDDRGKYKCSRGNKKPWFQLITRYRLPLAAFIIEGEINALSLKSSYPGINTDIYSPGGANNFTDAQLQIMLPKLKQYRIIHIIVDSDMPGVNAAIALKKELHKTGVMDIHIHLMDKDCNQLLVERGVEGIREALEIRETV